MLPRTTWTTSTARVPRSTTRYRFQEVQRRYKVTSLSLTRTPTVCWLATHTTVIQWISDSRTTSSNDYISIPLSIISRPLPTTVPVVVRWWTQCTTCTQHHATWTWTTIATITIVIMVRGWRKTFLHTYSKMVVFTSLPPLIWHSMVRCKTGHTWRRARTIHTGLHVWIIPSSAPTVCLERWVVRLIFMTVWISKHVLALTTPSTTTTENDTLPPSPPEVLSLMVSIQRLWTVLRKFIPTTCCLTTRHLQIHGVYRQQQDGWLT